MRKYLLSFTLLSVVGLGFSSCKSKQKVSEFPSAQKVATIDRNEQESEVPVSSAVEIEEVRDERFSLDAEEKDDNVLSKKYHVVVGSFKKIDNARALKSTLDLEGNNATVVINEYGMHRVILVSYDEYREARAKIRSLDSRFSDAWVLTQRH